MTHHPRIVKVKYDTPTGKFRCATDEYIIGYVFRGVYCIHDYYNDRCVEIGSGHVYLLSVGDHICEAFPDEKGSFEQIVFKFSSDDLKTVIIGFSVGGEDNSMIERITLLSRFLYVVKQADDSIHLLFRSLDMLHGDYSRADNYIRLSLIVYFMANSDDRLLCSELSDGKGVDNSKFEREVYANIYTNLPLEEIASKCCLSMSSFKRKFSRHFHTSPHRWFLEKRMCRAHGMLITTDMCVSEIGRACGFSNQSHFIKVFRRHYGMTPTLYRRKYADNISVRMPSSLNEKVTVMQ
ncbi:MAG: helix-turn-helix transcriptional regulator [Alistipes sp.]|nr:helix-turn-helix transcriptional regulator [Alistipes sp.]